MSRGIGLRDVDSVVVEFTGARWDQDAVSGPRYSCGRLSIGRDAFGVGPKRWTKGGGMTHIEIVARTMVVDFSANYQANFSLCRACPVKNQLYATTMLANSWHWMSNTFT
jgi:hypothetical protein